MSIYLFILKRLSVHQESVLNPLLFMAVMEVPTYETREGLPREKLYVDDLMLVAESMGELKENGEERWKEYMEAKELKIHINKTRIMFSGKNCGDVERVEK